MVREVILPKLGQTMEEGTIVEWLKQEGDPVQRGEVLFTVESDKATLEVETSGRGFLRKILAPAGATRPVLSVVALMTRDADEDITGYGGPAGVEPAAEGAAAPAAATLAEPTRELTRDGVGRVFSSPRARKLAREKGVDLALIAGSGPNGRIVERDVVAHLQQLPRVTPVARRLAEQAGLDLRLVQGSGPGGRISKGDIERALAAARAPIAAPAPPEVTEIEAAPTPVAGAEVPVSGVRAVIARRMFASHQLTAPVTLTTEADATAFVTLREQLKAQLADALGFNIGYNDLMIKVVAHALREFPYMNARLQGEVTPDAASGTIQQLDEVNVALAVDTERGLLVPVIRNADGKGVGEIGRDVRQLVERARTGKASPDELSGSTFTITNLGMHEIDAFSPLINLPEAAILGVGRIKARPAVVEGQICVRQMVWLSLTFDHRLVDGAPAARFLQRIKQLVEAPYLLLA